MPRFFSVPSVVKVTPLSAEDEGHLTPHAALHPCCMGEEAGAKAEIEKRGEFPAIKSLGVHGMQHVLRTYRQASDVGRLKAEELLSFCIEFALGCTCTL